MINHEVVSQVIPKIQKRQPILYCPIVQKSLDINHQNLADSDDDRADSDFGDTNAVALADTTANRLHHRDQSQRRRRVIGCSTLTFSGRTILSVTYIGFLFWHREKDTISSLMDDS
jgi:hypothetical protein